MPCSRHNLCCGIGITTPAHAAVTINTGICCRAVCFTYALASCNLISYLITSHQRRPCRERYRKAAELSRVRGKLSCLLINDLDAGLGHFANTQVTVNNQARSPPPRLSPPVGYLRPSVHASDLLSDKTGFSAVLVCHQVSLAELMCTMKHCPWVWV